jgi:hypothetical protein
MPEDITFPFEFADSGDVKSVKGQQFYHEYAKVLALQVTTNVDSLGGGLTPNTIAKIESAIERKYRTSEYLNGPLSVTVSNVDGDNETLTLSVNTAELDGEIDV